MKMKFIFAICIAGIMISSCQKGVDWGATTTTGSGGTGGSGGSGGSGGGGSTTGTQLYKKVGKTGTTDSTVFTYGYDANKKLTSYTIKGISSGTVTDQRNTFTRDATGRVTAIKQITLSTIGTGYDTSYTTVYYTSPTSTNIKYTTNTATHNFGGLPITYTDSVPYTYLLGKVISTTTYIGFFGMYTPSSLYVYGYDANGNVNNVKLYATGIATGTPDQTRTYTYDTKVSPLQLGGGEAIALLLEESYGVNNVNTTSMTNTAVASANFTGTYTYVYRTDNQPLSASGTVIQGGATTTATATYYYQ